jgi:Flp pilus assembly protein TadD
MKINRFLFKMAFASTLLLSSFSIVCAQTLEQHNESARLNNQGLALSRENRHEEAIKLFNRSLEIEEDQITFYNRATAFFRLKRYKEALQDAQSVMKGNSNSTEGLWLRAKIQTAQNNHTAAFEDLNRLLLLEPENPVYALERGNTALEIRKFTEGLDSYYYAASLAQRGILRKEDQETVMDAVKSSAGDIYAVLGLPSSPFLKKTTLARTSPDVDEKAKVNAGELRFDGICVSVDASNGTFSMDVLSVGFPNGVTKILPQPKKKLLQLKGAAIVNALNPQFSGKPTIGDFMVAVGTDNGRIVSPRLLAIGTHNFTGFEPKVDFAAIGRPQFVLENRSYRAGTAFFVKKNNSRYMVCAWHLLHNNDSLPDQGAKQTLDTLKEVRVTPYAGNNIFTSREVITREGFSMGERGNDLTGDYFVMKTQEAGPTLPLSTEAPIRHQSVWVAGQTVNESTAKLYKAYVASSTEKGLVLLMEAKQSFVIQAMSGAPIVDSSGGVVGILLGGSTLETGTIRIMAAPVSALQSRFPKNN